MSIHEEECVYGPFQSGTGGNAQRGTITLMWSPTGAGSVLSSFAVFTFLYVRDSKKNCLTFFKVR